MTQEQEYIIMASGEVVTRERIEAWAESANENAESLLAEMLAFGELAEIESTPS